jgi:hypothetical protein
MSEQLLKGQLKRYLIKYFDGVQFEIDIQAQKLLEKLEDGSQKREDVLKRLQESDIASMYINKSAFDLLKEFSDNSEQFRLFETIK